MLKWIIYILHAEKFAMPGEKQKETKKGGAARKDTQEAQKMNEINENFIHSTFLLQLINFIYIISSSSLAKRMGDDDEKKKYVHSVLN